MNHLPDIALIGRAGAGKSTVRELLVDHFRYQWFALANPLKDIAETLWGVSARTDRGKLQGLGVAVRQIHPDTWVNLLVNDIASHPSATNAVVDDVRFPNELDALCHRGFLVVRVEAPAPIRADRLWRNGKLQNLEQLEHESETQLDTECPDWTITNEQGTPELLDQVTTMVNRLSS